MNASSSLLAGRRVLLVEDDFFVVEDMRLEFEAIGASVIGPAATVDDALRLVAATDQLDAAVLDVNLRGAMVYPVADALTARGVPFVFATGYDSTVIPPRFAGVKRCAKPVQFARMMRTLFPPG